jgi:hypothetical protein
MNKIMIAGRWERRRTVVKEEKRIQTSCEGLHNNVVGKEVRGGIDRRKRRRQEGRDQTGGSDQNRTNLVAGYLVEEEHGAGELGLDYLVPEPLHRSAVHNIR